MNILILEKLPLKNIQKFSNLFSQISEKDTAKTIWIDPPSIEINFRKKTLLNAFIISEFFKK